MLSGVLAGALRIGVVALASGGLAGGVYLLVQVGEGEDASRLQAPQATITAPAPTPTPPAAIPTPPGPAATPPEIDTSDWLTYTSPLGFTIKYPPGWTVELGLPNIRVVSPETAQAIAEEFPGWRPGMAEVGFYIEADTFDANVIIENCLQPPALGYPGDQPDTASAVTFLGRRAVLCVQSERGRDDPTSPQRLGLGYVVELTPDTLLTVYGFVVPEGAIQFPLLEAMFSESALGGTQ